jgi:hypothetical protein
MPEAAQPLITAAPAYSSSRQQLAQRAYYDLSDYGFVIAGELGDVFEIVPINVDDEQAFFFFFAREDIVQQRYSLFNLHAFLKYSGSVEDFAHSRGESVATIALSPTKAFGTTALTYDRKILMRDLFKGAPQVIDFIGGRPDLLVRDSHTYLTHRHNHYYSGMIHIPGDEARYDALRTLLFGSIELV